MKPMKITLISRDNGVGLTTDMDLLSDFLGRAGHTVTRVDWRARDMARCDIAIFLELFNPRLVRQARRTIGIFNLEWFDAKWRPYLPRFSQLWCKSREAQGAYDGLRLRNHHYTGFLSRDLHLPEIEKWNTCLHVAGHSRLKNTEAVLDAWRSNPDLPPLTVVATWELPGSLPPGVRALGRLAEHELIGEMNRNRIHLCPSRSEGWGHYITEGMLTGAVVVTTDRSPMNEHVHPPALNTVGVLIQPRLSTKRGHVSEHHISPIDIAEAVRGVAASQPSWLAAVGRNAREHVLSRNRQFESTALNLLERLAR